MIFASRENGKLFFDLWSSILVKCLKHTLLLLPYKWHEHQVEGLIGDGDGASFSAVSIAVISKDGPAGVGGGGAKGGADGWAGRDVVQVAGGAPRHGDV